MIKKLEGLYQNWQVEYKEAMTPEQCEDIQRFYEPYVQKYETKYKILYQTLRQALAERKRTSSPRVSAPELTPSLVALEEASTLKEKNGIEVNHIEKLLRCIPQEMEG